MLLYPKEADFHFRQGKPLWQPADTRAPRGSVTSTGREACLLEGGENCHHHQVGQHGAIFQDTLTREVRDNGRLCPLEIIPR